MTQVALLHIDGATEGTTQWRAETLQMVNWGGFHGHHTVRLSPGATLLSGASGTGKSTLLDAYIALMMPSDTPFNGASNDATVGRARSADQRNLLTYLRGKTDTSRIEGTDELRDQVLRGIDGAPTWGAVAMTFVNDIDRRYTVTRIYFVRAGASTNSDVTTTFAATDGYLDLARLAPIAASRFDKRTLKANFPTLQPFDKFWEFEQNLHTRLGIGANGDGRKAQRLLARVQAGMQVKTVDGLYKSMVLEEPVTYQHADRAIEHFADLEAAYEKMLDEADKVHVLRRLPELQADLAKAQAEALLLDQFGIHRDGDSPFLLWKLLAERALLDTAVDDNRRRHREETTRLTTATGEERRLRERLQAIDKDKAANGGDAINALTDQIQDLQEQRRVAYQANLKFQHNTETIGLPVPETAEEFADAQAASQVFLGECANREKELDDEIRRIGQDEEYPLARERSELVSDLESLKGRNGMVPRHLHRARVDMAEAAGLDPMNDLPFVAELIDVLPNEEPWRKAIETTLGGLARVVLVDRNTRDHLSRSIDGVTIRPRINYEAVTLQPHRDEQGNPDYVSGKLAFKDSPFSTWVQGRVSDNNVDHLCVPNADALSGREPRVTRSGQTRHGDKGAHGESSDGNIIGFSNERRLAELTDKITALDERLRTIQGRAKELRDRLSALRRHRDDHQYVVNAQWADIDYASIDTTIEELSAQKERIVAASDILTTLQQEEDLLRPQHEKANSEMVLAKKAIEDLDKDHVRLCDDQDTVTDATDRIENAQTVTLTDEQTGYLNTLFSREWDATDLRGFHANMKHLKARLAQESLAAQKAVRDTSTAMTTMFEAFQAHPGWHDPNLGTSPDSADGYREILDRIQSTGLHDRKEEWRRSLSEWSSEDLVRVNGAFDSAIEDIEERLDPINAILRGLPFGGKGHLQINLRRLHNDDVAKFRKMLRALAAGVAEEQSEPQVEERFKRLRTFMNLIRIPEGHTKTSTSQRDKYLDVRQHVVITAACVDDQGHEVATYAALGGKSGGETQELVAFIVGAALRFQLGDESRTRPRFAPVFLDEAFVKADSEFARRGVQAWQKLGFQLIIGAPLDKVTALERYMDLILTVNKNTKGHSFVTDLPSPTGGESA
ncbi:ATP-binding protein [Nocardioides donggukensis]|uniref:AAA family ATPase n=1 Tax=Nocardioides donggukensis TaxID=2774019 RepID=A0A927Q0G4_9ACTN|nr:SbcC/MukB-like Walker B domain-containing protein [Nocardioides donggukensis]MBD8870615.1 AAA family ATPase [Nocardioides donggukensis]